MKKKWRVITVISVVKEMKGVALKETKAFVNTLPCHFEENLTEEQAVADKYRLESIG